jgi:hypothetical protein
MTGAPTFIARSITLQIFSAYASESEPPKTVKSWLKTKTRRPSIVPWPVTTPSPRMCCSARPNSVARWVTNASNSTNDPGSSSRSRRSRAVSLPHSCCRSIRTGPRPASPPFASAQGGSAARRSWATVRSLVGCLCARTDAIIAVPASAPKCWTALRCGPLRGITSFTPAVSISTDSVNNSGSVWITGSPSGGVLE